MKLEDIQHSSESPADTMAGHASSLMQSSPPPVIVHSKQAKKRKSWGQELPEPKTSLPPRKRAKTDDEKEQRRIERIKRNRAAAHNSRERKRQETETLAVALARANAELEAYRNLHGPLPSNIVLPEITLSSESTSQSAATPAPSLVESYGSLSERATSPASPAGSVSLGHHGLHVDIKEEPLDSSSLPSAITPSFPSTITPAFSSLDVKPVLSTPLDLTQHSAAMLCDPQCRSTVRPLSSRHTASGPSTRTATWWARLYLCLLTIQIQTAYKVMLLAIWTTSPSRMAHVMQASTLRLTSRSKTSSTTRPLLPTRSTPRCLALCNAATGLGAPRDGAGIALQLWPSRPESLSQARSLAEPARPASPSSSPQQATALSDVTVLDQTKRDEGCEGTGVGRELV